LLIDEADIFMEARDLSNITRNAIVSVFLQFLEYNRNIVFLTTNRLSTIDPAIQSRINMIIQYQNLQEADRIKVWKNCLTKWPDLLNNKKLIKSLSKFELNGRQILKIAQTAMSVLVFKGSDVSEKTFLETVEKCYKINMEFNAVTGIVKSSLYC
jgi:SpoVK/Ycf46/Vps4 family AAA+-type ATPase